MHSEASPRTALYAGLVVASYFGAAKLGLMLPFSHASVFAVWPPAGIALAAVVLGGYGMLAPVAIGALLANLTTSTPLVAVLGVSAGSTLAAFAGAASLRRVDFQRSLARVRDVIALLLLGCGLSAAISVTVGTATLLAVGSLHTSALAGTWRTWWLAVVCGDLLLGSAALVLAGRRPRVPRIGPLLEELVIYALLAAVNVLVFRAVSVPVYVVFPMLFLPALLYRQRGAVIGSLVVAAISLWYSAHGHGPFAELEGAQGLLRAQTFVGVAAVTSLLVAASRSERQSAEQAVRRLADSERALGEAQHLARIGSFEWDIRGDRTTWSDELYDIFGVSRERYPDGYHAWLQCVHEDDRGSVDQILRTAYAERAPYKFVHRIVRPDGHTRMIECHGRLELDHAGRPARMVGTAQDITAIKLAEERFRGLLETAPDGMVIIDEQGRIVLVNSQTERLFGYPRQQLIGQLVDMLLPARFVVPRAEHRAAFARDPRPVSMGQGLDLFARRRDGTEFPVEITLSPLQTEDGMLFSAAVRDVTERKQTADALAHQARHDPLTGLPNRALFFDRLEHALARARRSQAKLAVLFVDLDDFKAVNDTLGHEAGDLLLSSLTPRLNSALRPGDTVARLGGDEFVVLCEDLAAEADAVRIAQRIAEACGRPLSIGAREHELSVSTGVVIVEGGAGTAADVLHDADVAMYRAKAVGKGRVEVFDKRLRARLRERATLEAQLGTALERGELRLHYQPIVSLSSGEIVAVESLLRWQHSERGLLEPGDFFEAAESGGVLMEIGEWTIAEACRQAARWRTPRPGADPIRVSVNLNARQVARGDTGAAVTRALHESSLDADRLELEITEGAMIEECPGAEGGLLALKSTGARLVLDDFGTGRSSISCLKRFTIDGLKIDRSFVEGLATDDGDQAIVNAVLSMAGALGVRVTAEGVETPEQLTRLREHGCAFAQGFLFSPPVNAGELEELLDQTSHLRELALQR